MSAALAGIRVIDITRAFGDYAVDVMAAPTFRFLADFGSGSRG